MKRKQSVSFSNAEAGSESTQGRDAFPRRSFPTVADRRHDAKKGRAVVS
jgi:hypothetical protein